MIPFLLSLGLTLHGILTTGYTDVGTTALGANTAPGVAACPPWMAFHTQVWLDGIGVVTCLDRYSPALSDRIDVFVTDVATAYRITGVREYVVLGDTP